MSIFLAKAFCLYLIIVGVALFFNSRTWPAMYDDFFRNRPALALSGFVALILGIILILTHNIWVLGWPLIITIASWTIFIKGTLLLVFTDRMIIFSKQFTREYPLKIAGSCMILFGLILGYFGFFS